MAQVVASKPFTQESSMFLTRPDFKSFLRPDTNVGNTDVTTNVEKKIRSDFHIPTATGPIDYQIKCCDDKLTSSYAKNNSYISTSIMRNKESKLIDPISNFVSPSGELMINSGKNVTQLGKVKIEPHTIVPQRIHSVRVHEDAIDEIKRMQEGESNPDLKWSSKLVSDLVLKSRLGGWTSTADRSNLQNKPKSAYKLREIFPNMKIEYRDENERDELAKNYRFKTSVQQMYEQVNWDAKLPKKLHAPVTTYEFGKPDPLKREESDVTRPQIWQTSAGATWDRMQARTPHFHRQDVSFTEPNKRANHMPGYSGHYGGKNHIYMDEVIEKFEPFTVLRTQQPKPPDANYKPNIPGYTGITHPFKTNSVSHYDLTGRPYTTTAAYHRQMPHVEQTKPEEAKGISGDFSMIQTKTPPQNPFDNIKRPVNTDINHSLDHVQHPIVTQKNAAHEDYLLANKEQRLRSILKKN